MPRCRSPGRGDRRRRSGRSAGRVRMAPAVALEARREGLAALWAAGADVDDAEVGDLVARFRAIVVTRIP